MDEKGPTMTKFGEKKPNKIKKEDNADNATS
jgi:hypothetical protein